MTDDLKRFIEGFEDEDGLRRAVEALLTKMPGCTNVRSTHGSAEQGKDIVFCSAGAMGEPILNACVIKNDKITGSADSSSGARTVFHQVEQALDTPILDEQGVRQSVARVYVITPHECSTQAMESISGKFVQRSGQIAFLCGNELLGKFKRYWPDFLLANVKFLGAHIKALRDELDKDPSVTRLLFREGFSAAQSRSVGTLYVRPRLACTLRTHQLKLHVPLPNDFESPMAEQEAGRAANAFRNLANLIDFFSRSEKDEADDVARNLNKLAGDVQEIWVSSFNVYRTSPDVDPQQISRGRSQVTVPMTGGPVLRKRASELLARSKPFTDKLREHLTISNELSGTKFSNPLRLLGSANLADFYLISDISRRVPSFVAAAHGNNKIFFDKGVMDGTTVPLLITGPAGYGKTSFCRWNALRDLEALEKKQSNVLPIYIQLHKLSDKPLTSFQDAFLSSEELSVIWRELNETKAGAPWRLRVYLDGLDEVPSKDRQMEISRIASSAISSGKTQIIMTARDHVTGRWLSWLRRLEIQPFDDEEIRQLVEKWLDGDTAQVLTFYEKLAHVPSLASLMKVPLLGTLILAVYKHGHESLPESRPRLYEMFVRLLAGGWDAAKNINRGSKFNPQTKMAVISHLAGVLHEDRRRDCFIRDVQDALRTRVPGLQNRGAEILSELIADGLLVPTGSILSFPHLSFQEFLAAKDLVQLRPDRANQRLDAFLSGDDWWREVLNFYVSFHDKPSEIEAWIASGVGRVMPRTSDEVVRSRAIELCRVILTNFSNFRFLPETRDLLHWYSESAFEIGKTKAPKPSVARR